jgi:hypothetical protein
VAFVDQQRFEQLSDAKFIVYDQDFRHGQSVDGV